jgi:hypothetical protein
VKRAHQGKGRILQGLAGTSLRDSITSLRISLDCIRFLVYLLVVAFALRSPLYISISLTGFPHGGFSRVMLTKNLCVHLSCLLSISVVGC